MKLLDIIIKNFKLIYRSKSSAFVIILGPLIILALIAFAFSNSQEYKISIGVNTPDNNTLSNEFIQSLEDNNYIVKKYDNLDSCIQEVKTQLLNLCIKLPQDFVIENNKSNQIEFFVDQSRMNLVESITSSVSTKLSLKSEEISYSLTQNLIDTIQNTNEKVNENQIILQNLNNENSKAEAENLKISSKTKSSSIGSASTQLSTLNTDINQLSSTKEFLDTEIHKLLLDLNKLLLDLERTNSSYTLRTKVKEDYNTLNSSFSGKIEEFEENIQNLESSLINVKKSVDAANQDITNIKNSNEILKINLVKIKNDTVEIERRLDNIKSKIEQIKVTSAENIINPTNIKINPLVTSSNRSFYLFPYFITLIIFFIGIMLSSILVVMEKNSLAFFRTFTTPTGEIYHVFARYLTNFIILSAQLSIIFSAAYFYLKISLIQTYSQLILTLMIIITFSILLGQLIGYIFKTQESVTIASISVASLFLFLSNLILPIESLPNLIQKIFYFSPYNLGTEMLKKIILFQAGVFDLKKELLFLMLYIIIIFILIILFQKIYLTKFFTGFSNRKTLKRPHITTENYFRLESGEILHNKNELLTALKKINPSEMNHYVQKRNNEFALLIKEAFKERSLARKIKKAKTLEKTIIILEENSKNNGK